jgi:hypothetical protein
MYFFPDRCAHFLRFRRKKLRLSTPLGLYCKETVVQRRFPATAESGAPPGTIAVKSESISSWLSAPAHPRPSFSFSSTIPASTSSFMLSSPLHKPYAPRLSGGLFFLAEGGSGFHRAPWKNSSEKPYPSANCLI